MTVVEFILARYAEIAQVAEQARHGGEGRWSRPSPDLQEGLIEDERGTVVVYDEGTPTAEEAQHITLNDPAWVLEDLATKRLLLAEHEVQDPGTDYAHCRVCHNYETHDAMSWPCRTVQVLARSFAGHADYDESWRPA